MKELVLFACFSTLLLPFAFGQEPLQLSDWQVRVVPSETNAPLYTQSLEGFQPYNGGAIPRDPSISDPKVIFVIDLQLKKPANGTTLGLMVPPGDFPCDIYFNDILIGKIGSHGGHYASTIYYTSRFPIDTKRIRESNRIVVEAYPGQLVNPLPRMMIANWLNISSETFWRNVFNVNLIQASFIFALILAAFFVLLFFFSLFSGFGPANTSIVHLS